MYSLFLVCAVLKTIHSVKHIINDEECRGIAKDRLWWQGFALAFVAKPPGVVQEILGMLEKHHGMVWYADTTNGIKSKLSSICQLVY